MNRYGVCSNWVEMDFTAPIANSNTHKALGSNNQRSIAVNWPEISMVYRDNGKIYCITSPDTGKTWNSPEYVGGEEAGTPAAAYAPNGDLYVMWVENYKNLLLARKTRTGWNPPDTIDMGTLLVNKAPPSMVVDKNGDVQFFLDGYFYITWEPGQITGRWVYGKIYTSTTPFRIKLSEVDSTVYQEPPPPPPNVLSCNIALTENDTIPQLAYDKEGEIWYATLDSKGNWQKVNVSNTPDLWSKAPSMDVDGLNVNIVYQEETSPNSGLYKLISKTGFVSSTKSGQFQSDTFAINTGNASNPFVIANKYLFFEKESGLHKAIYRCDYDPLLFGWKDTVKVSDIPWADAKNPQAVYYYSEDLDPRHGLIQNGLLAYAWAEGKEPHIMVQEKDSSWSKPGIPIYHLLSVNLGGLEPSPFTVQRAGYIDYSSGSYPYESVDYHPEELIYRISGLNPENRYWIGLTYYQKSGNIWKERLKIDQTPMGEKRVPSGVPVPVLKQIPDVDVQDGEIEIHIIKKKGDYAVCGVMYLYETPKIAGLGGPQFSSTGIKPTIGYSLHVYPNPITNSGSVRFTIPEKMHINISLYDEIGRRVSVLFNGEKDAGAYSINLGDLKLSSGVYFVIMNAKKRFVKKMIVLTR